LLFREISYRKILQNFAKYREIFVTKLKFSQGKIYFLILLHFNTTKKITFMSKIHKHLYVSISIFSVTDPMIWIRAKIYRIRNAGKTFKKCWLKLIFMYWIRKIYITKQFREMFWYLKNLHNETIPRNNLYGISQNFAKEITTKFRGVSRN
jgi:hypothetical protein